MSIKTSAEEWVRKGPMQAVAVIAAVGIVVGGLVGLGVGYKIEQSRTKSDVKKLQQQLSKEKSAKSGVVLGALGERIGKVTASSGGSITVLTKTGRSQELSTSASTVFETAARGTIADVNSGRRILVTPKGAEIIVLPADSKLGRVVTKITSASILIAKGNGFPAGSLSTSGVHSVETLKPAKITDVKTGVHVLAGGRAATGKKFNTIEVIVLSNGSGFGG